MVAATKQLGYPGLCPKQELAVKNFLSGRDVFMSLPSGSGKLPCYCILPKVFDILRSPTASQSSVMVVSPLIALMKDQVWSMVEKGVQCNLKGPKYYLNSKLTRINCQMSWRTQNSQLSLGGLGNVDFELDIARSGYIFFLHISLISCKSFCRSFCRISSTFFLVLTFFRTCLAIEEQLFQPTLCRADLLPL